MAKKQTRRAISVKGLTYQRIKKHCEGKDLTISGWVEAIVNKKLDELGVAEETILEPKPTKQPTLGNYTGNHFTF